MKSPLSKGTEKLSLIGRVIPSTTVATKAPMIPTHNGRRGTKSATKRHMKRQDKLPSTDFRLFQLRLLCAKLHLIFVFPNLLPIRAAAISPRMIKEIAANATLLSKRRMARNEAERM